MMQFNKTLSFLALSLVAILYAKNIHSQISHNSQWSWRNGQTSSAMVRGPKGVASTFYNPGAREGAAQFKDPNGNLWIYGGSVNGNTYGDLWFFNIQTDQWTWVSGTTDLNAEPVFGTFRSGSFTTFPGARFESYNWYDEQSGKLWLYGGIAYGSGVGWRNDLWSYELQTGIWTWMSGSTQMNAPRFGSSFSSPNNTPGARNLGVSWYVYNSLDPYQSFTSLPLPPRPCSKLYLAFGFGSGIGRTQDIWVYNTDDNNWMFLSDISTVINGIQSAPYRREGSSSWQRTENFGTTQDRDVLYCYGGYGADRTGIEGYLEDLWRYDIVANEWQFVSGSQYINPPTNGTRPGVNWKRKADISDDESKVYLFGLQNNEVWEYSYNLDQWNKFSAPGSKVYGVQTGQGPTVKPHSGFDANVWYGQNRLYTFGGGSVFTYFNPCTSNSITASLTSVNDPSDDVTFTCNAIGTGPITYLWRRNNSVASLVSSPTFTTAGILPTDVYSCFVTAYAACASNIRLVSYSNNISISCTPPANDAPCNAAGLTLDDQPAYGNNTYATSTGDAAGTCYGAASTVWYKYTPPTSGYVQFTLGAGLSGDTLNSWVSLFTSTAGNCPSSITLADSTATTLGGCRYYHAPANKNPTVWSSFLSSGKTYYFRLSGLYGDIGRYRFSIQSTAASVTKSGTWRDPTIWSTNRTPTNESRVTVSLPVTVDSAAVCKSLTMENDATITLQTGQTLTVLNDAGTVPPGAALAFDGVNDYVHIPHNIRLKPSAAITIEAWIKPVDIHSTAYAEIYRKEDGDARHLLSFQNNGTILSFGLGVGGIYSELDVPVNAADYEGQWVHVAATFDGATKKIYRNNVLIGTQNANGQLSTTGTAPAIIGSLGGYAEFFNGSIDEFRLWDRAIPVESRLNCELPNTEAGLILYYKFNQGVAGGANATVNRAADASSNGLNGFLLNFSLSGVLSNWIAPGAVQSGFVCNGGN